VGLEPTTYGLKVIGQPAQKPGNCGVSATGTASSATRRIGPTWHKPEGDGPVIDRVVQEIQAAGLEVIDIKVSAVRPCRGASAQVAAAVEAISKDAELIAKALAHFKTQDLSADDVARVSALEKKLATLKQSGRDATPAASADQEAVKSSAAF